MQKTFASLLVTLAVSVMGIPVAYLVGQRSAEHDVERRLTEERARARAEQQALISDLRENLAPKPAVATQPAKSAPVAALPAPVVGPKPAEKLAETAGPPAPTVAPESAAPADQAPPPAAESVAKVLPAIPREFFEAVALGATYPEIAQKFGREGVPALTMEDERGSLTRQYIWQWIGPEGKPGRVTLRFVDGSLTDKDYHE
jgi:hypothetical protein